MCGCELFNLESFAGWGSERVKQTLRLKEASQSILIDYNVTDAAIALLIPVVQIHDACFYEVKQRGMKGGRAGGGGGEIFFLASPKSHTLSETVIRRVQRKHKQERAFAMTFMGFMSTDVSIAAWATMTYRLCNTVK